YGWFGAFVAALTPIPDDIVYIPLGLAKYNPWKFATATFAGKFLMNETIVWGSVFLGRPFVEDILSSDRTNGTSLIIATIVSAIVLAVVVYFSLRIDWAKIIGRWFPWALQNDNEELKEDRNDHTNNDDKNKST
ncbi:MAG: VTT domain-containing protein, partial [Thermoproteota archaeon]|nr:VTT domain-containing protein [Thermoproteota archaeon]